MKLMRFVAYDMKTKTHKPAVEVGLAVFSTPKWPKCSNRHKNQHGSSSDKYFSPKKIWIEKIFFSWRKMILKF